jgi:hypothetical protein
MAKNAWRELNYHLQSLIKQGNKFTLIKLEYVDYNISPDN